MITDEVTDSHSNQEIMSLCLRFVDCPLAKADCIISIMSKLGLPIEDMQGQAYDGAAAMSSCNVGVQANIKLLIVLALYMHFWRNMEGIEFSQAIQ